MNLSLADIRTMVCVATRRTGTPVRDEDLEQDIALRAVAAFRRLERVARPHGLLMKIVEDHVRDYWRRRRPFEDLELISERFTARGPDFEFDLDVRRRLELLEQGVRTLSPHRRKLIQLFYRDDMTVREIARVEKKSVSAIKMELLRSRKELARIVRLLTTKKSRCARKG